MFFQPLLIKKNICAVVVSHDPDEGFLLNIRSIMLQVDKIVVVNNGSKKITLNFLAKAGLGQKIHLIVNPRSFGQGKALNQGVNWALSQGSQWVLLMDQDGLPDSLMVENLIKAYQACPYREKVKMIAANCTYRGIGEIKYLRECQGELFFERDVVMLTGTLLFLPAYKKIGPFREEFFIDSIDTDYSLRTRKSGFRIIVACRAQMLHGIGEKPTFRRFFGKKFLVTNHSPVRCYYMTRNGLILVKEYFFREPYWVLRRIVWHFLVKPCLVILFEKDKFMKLRSMFLGGIHALIGKTNKKLCQKKF